MKMVSTKVYEPHADAVEYDPRPCVYLNDDIVEQLGLKGIPAPGTTFIMQARVVAMRVNASVEEAEEVPVEGNAPDVALELRITNIGLEPEKVSDTERASMLYGG